MIFFLLFPTTGHCRKGNGQWPGRLALIMFGDRTKKPLPITVSAVALNSNTVRELKLEKQLHKNHYFLCNLQVWGLVWASFFLSKALEYVNIRLRQGYRMRILCLSFSQTQPQPGHYYYVCFKFYLCFSYMVGLIKTIINYCYWKSDWILFHSRNIDISFFG